MEHEEVVPIWKEATEFMEGTVDLLTDEKQKDYFTKTIASLKTASGLVEDSDEKMARLCDAAVKYANQLAFILFRQGALSEEHTAKFRSLPTPEYTGDEVRKFEDVRQAKIDSINKQQQEVMDEQKALDIFTAVIAGMSEDEAKQRMAEHEQQIKEMSQRQEQ